jgi:methyl-accepting chemotaxis protein
MPDQYKRIGKGGADVWIQASYNPIMDASGRPYKVVKYATDITAQTKAAQMMQQAVQQVQVVVEATKANDLTARIDLDGKSGDIRALCAGVNDLVSTMTDSSAASAMRPMRSRPPRRKSRRAARIWRSARKAGRQYEETAASMHEVTTTVKQNADNAQAANQLAAAARDTADKGGRCRARCGEPPSARSRKAPARSATSSA